MQASDGDCRAWSVAGVDCFRATSLTRTYARHTHEGFAVGVIERGTGINHYRGATRRFPAGSIVAMNPDESHTGAAADRRGLTYRMFYVQREAWMNLVPLHAHPRFREPCIRDSAIASALVAAHEAIETEDLLTGFGELAGALAKLAEKHGDARAVDFPAREPLAIARAKEYLRANHHRSISGAELAALVGLSEAHLIRAFRRAAGVPPHAWLLQQRVELARERLMRGDGIADVAASLGFADQSHFTRRFRGITGVTPRQFVKGQFRSIR